MQQNRKISYSMNEQPPVFGIQGTDQGESAPFSPDWEPICLEESEPATIPAAHRKPTPLEIAHFRFGLIAAVITDTYADASASEYYRRVSSKPLRYPDGTYITLKPCTIEKWVVRYRKDGLDGLMPKERSDKGNSRVLNNDAVEELYRLMEKFPKLSAVGLRVKLLEGGFINIGVSERSIQRFIRQHDLRSARNPRIKDRKSYETSMFGCVWQADTCYTEYITEDGATRRTYLIIVVDDHSRMLLYGEFFYNDNAENFLIVLKKAVEIYGVPDMLYTDHGSSYENMQVTRITDSLGVVHRLAPVRDGAAKAKVERTFGVIKTRHMFALDLDGITSLEEFNRTFRDYIRKHNTMVNRGIGEQPLQRYMRTKDHIRIPQSQKWIDECFMHRQDRKVRNDATIRFENVFYDVDSRFIGKKVEIRYEPGHFEEGYILYNGERYPITRTDKIANSRARRRNPGITVSYMEGGDL